MSDYLYFANLAREAEQNREWLPATEYWEKALQEAQTLVDSDWAETRTRFCRARLGLMRITSDFQLKPKQIISR